MKIAYLTQNPVKVSETFFNFLIKGLENKSGIDAFWHIVGSNRGPSTAKNTLFTNFVLNFRLLRLVNEFEERSGMSTRMALGLMQSAATKRLSKVLKVGRPDVAHIEYGTTAIRVYKFFKKNKIPFIVHFHGQDASAEFNSKFYQQEALKVFDNAEFVVTASQHVKRLLILRGCQPSKIQVVPYGINVENIVPLDWKTRSNYGPSIVSLGRLTEKKNPIALLHAFELVKKKVPKARLTYIGDGALRFELERRIESLGLGDSVELCGALEQSEAINIVNKHWIFAQHNVTAVDGDQEGYSLAPAEAAAMELPVVSTLHNGIPEHVIDGETGFLVREFDYVTMADKLVTLLENTEMAVSFGKAGRQNIRMKNDPVNRINSIHQLLMQACNSTNDQIKK
jgi:glycosyltransferase involved in cell wall biosynthesis